MPPFISRTYKLPIARPYFTSKVLRTWLSAIGVTWGLSLSGNAFAHHPNPECSVVQDANAQNAGSPPPSNAKDLRRAVVLSEKCMKDAPRRQLSPEQRKELRRDIREYWHAKFANQRH